MASTRIYVKKQIRLDRLTFQQRQMWELGSVGVAAVKSRVSMMQGPTDGPAYPLTKSYANFKVRAGAVPYRNLQLSGDMLRNFMVRTASEKQARAGTVGRGTTKTIWNKKGTRLVGVENRVKAWATQKIEPWVLFSPKNKKAVKEAATRMLIAAKTRMIIERYLGASMPAATRYK